MPLNNKSLIEVARKYNQRLFSELDDKEVYDYVVKNWNPEELSGVNGAEFAPWVDEQSVEEEPYLYKPYIPKMIDNTTQETSSPKSWMSSLSDMSLPGWVGDATDWNYLKYSAMQGSTDLLKAAMSGESSYQLKNEDGQVISPEEYATKLNMAQEVLAWGIGQFNATDIGIWVGTAGVGKAAQIGGRVIKPTFGAAKRIAPQSVRIKNLNRGISKANMSDEAFALTKKEYFDGVVRNSSNRLRANGNRYSNYLADYLDATPAAASSLGAFSFATGTVHSLNSQRMLERDADGIGIGDVDISTALWDGTKSGFEGMVLGSLIAGVSPGTSRVFGKMATKFEKAEGSLGQKMQKLFKSPYTQLAADIGIEGTLFSMAPYAWKGLPKDEEGNIDTDQMFHDWAHSLATIGMLKGSFKAYEVVMKEWKQEIDIDNEYSVSGDKRTSDGKNAKEAIEGMKQNLSDMGMKPAEIQKAVEVFLKDEFGKSLKEVDGVEKEMKESLLEKWDANQDIVQKIINGEKLTPEEASRAHTELAPLNRLLSQMDFKKLNTPEALDAHMDKYIAPVFRKQNQGKDWTPEQRAKERTKLEKRLKSRIKNLDSQANAVSDFVKTAEGKKGAKRVEQAKQKALEKEASRIGKLLEALPDESSRKKAVIKLVEKFEKENKELDELAFEDMTPEQYGKWESVQVEARKILEGPSSKERIAEAKESLKIELPEEKMYLIEESVVKGNDAKTAENLERVLKKHRESKEKPGKIETEINELDLKTKKLDLKTEGGKDKTTKDGKTVDDLIKASKLSERNKKMALIGFEKFLKPRDYAAGKYKQALEFFEYLQKNGYGINDATDRIFVDFLRSNKLITAAQQKPYQDIIASFYGGKAGGAKQKGFSDMYMDKDNVASTTRIPTVGAKRATVSSQEQTKLLETLPKFKETVVNTKPEVATSAIELQYYFGRRGTDLFKYLKAGDLNTKTGEITLSSAKKVAGVRVEQTFPLREILPELYNKLAALKKGKADTDLLIANKKGKQINVNALIDAIFAKGGIKGDLFGGKKKFTQGDWRKTLETDAKEFGLDIFAKDLTGRGKTVQETYVTKDFIDTFKDFVNKRLGKAPVEVKEAPIQEVKKKYPNLTDKMSNVLMSLENALSKGTKNKEEFLKIVNEKFTDIYSKYLEPGGGGNKKNVEFHKEAEAISAKYGEKYYPKERIQERMTVEGEVGRAATAKEKARVIRMLKKKYPEITLKLDQVELRDSNGKVITSDKVLETVVGTLVKVKKGAPIEAAVHGAIHPILKTLDAIAKANPKTKLGKTTAGLVREMYARARKNPRFNYWRKKYIKAGMNPKDAANRAAEEVTAEITGEYVAGRVMDKAVFQRVKDWLQRTYAALKTAFKDVENLSDKELTQLFGERFMKRKGIGSIVFERSVGERMEYMTITKDNTKDFKKRIDEVMGRFNLEAKDREAFVNLLKEEAGITRPDFSLKDLTFEEVGAIHEVIGKLNLRKLKEKTKIIERLKLKQEIDRHREDTNLKLIDQKEWLINEGVESGNLIEAPTKVLNEWHALLYEYRVDPKSLNQVGNELPVVLDKDINITKQISGSRLAKARHFAAKGLLGLHQFSKHLGLKNLSSWVLKHIASEQGHVGPFLHFADTLAPKLIGRSKWRKAKKIFTLLEANEKGEFIRLNDKTANSKEVTQAKLFIKKGFNVRVDRDGKWHNEGIKWDPKTQKGSDEGRLLHYFKHELVNNLPKKLDNIALSKFTKAKYESIMKSNDIKFLNKTNEAFYIPRRTTKAFQENFNLNAMKHAKAVEKAASEIAYDLAKDASGAKWDKLSKGQKEILADGFTDTARVIANAELHMLGTFGSQKIQFNHLMKRNRIKLDETVDIGGKKIKVWETDFDTAVLPFASGWGKFLANLEHAPWAVKLKGMKFDVDMNQTLAELGASMGFGGEKMRTIGAIIKKGVQRRVGTYSEDTIYSSVHNGAREYTSTLMRLQLAGPIPMSGIKNYFTQAIQMIHTHSLKDVIDTHHKAFAAKERAITEMMGATSSIGITGYKPKSEIMQRATDLVFRMGGMPLTESFARTWARLAADVDGRRLADMIQKNSKTSKSYAKAKTRLKEIYELTDSQIQLLERHGYEPMYNKMSAFDKNVVKLQMDGIDRQIQIVGNMKTAGATVDAMMPEIGNKKWMKPFLMYKRIAYVTTVNNASTMKYNWKNGHVMRSAAMVGATLISGGARMWLLKTVLGQTLPGENSDWAKSLQTALWQGEFLGILSELWSPYAGTWQSLSNDMLFSSAMTTHAWKSIVMMQSLGGHYSGLWESSATPGAALSAWGRSSSSSYNNIYKVMNQRNNKYNGAYKTIRQWKNDFEDKNGYFEDAQLVESESKKYFKDLRTAFNLGNMNELNEAVTLAYYGYASDKITAGASQARAYKEAKSQIKRTLTKLTPFMGSHPNDPKKGYYITPTQGFLKSLNPEQTQLVKYAYKEYTKRLNEFLKQYPHYLRKQNLKDIKEEFKFKIKPQYENLLK